MNRTTLTLAMLPVLLVAAPGARAAGTAPTERPRLSATETTVGVFGHVCVARAGNGPAGEAWLRTAQFQPAAPEQAAMLIRRQPPGAVWLSPDAGRLMAVVLRGQGITCQVMSPVAEPAVAVRLFRRLLEEAERADGLVAEKVEETREVPGGAGQGMRLEQIAVGRKRPKA